MNHLCSRRKKGWQGIRLNQQEMKQFSNVKGLIVVSSKRNIYGAKCHAKTDSRTKLSNSNIVIFNKFAIIEHILKITKLEFNYLIFELAPVTAFDTIYVVSRKRLQDL